MEIHNQENLTSENSKTFQILDDPELLEQLKTIPDKMAFKIGEVADLAGIKQHVLRYWESEFDVLKPKKSNHNQRMYTRKDVEMVLLIRKLLYKDRFSISGAREAIRKSKTEIRKDKPLRNAIKNYGKIQNKAQALLEMIRKAKATF